MDSVKIGNLTCNHQIVAAPEGQSIISVTATDGTNSYCHTVTIGAVDGNDALASLSDADLQTHLQTILDDARNHATKVLQSRLNVKTILAKLN